MKLLTLFLLMFVTFFCILSLKAEAPKDQTLSIQDYIGVYSFVYDVPVATLSSVIACESSFNPNAENITEREASFGLSQINLLAHRHISKEEALDPKYAIKFMAENISKGKGNMWKTCYGKAVEERGITLP